MRVVAVNFVSESPLPREACPPRIPVEDAACILGTRGRGPGSHRLGCPSSLTPQLGLAPVVLTVPDAVSSEISLYLLRACGMGTTWRSVPGKERGGSNCSQRGCRTRLLVLTLTLLLTLSGVCCLQLLSLLGSGS